MKMFPAVAAVAALGFAAAAHGAQAADTPNQTFKGSAGTFGGSSVTGTFDDTFTYDVGAGTYNISVSTTSPGIDFTTLTFDGQSIELNKTVNGIRFFGLKGVSSTSGTQTIIADGTFNAGDGYSTGSYQGVVTFTPVSGAPEPAAWALMMAGVAGVGMAFRQARRKDVLAAA